MSLDQIVNVSIVVSATAPSNVNFGVPALFAYHNFYPDLVRYYTSLAGLASDIGSGFAAKPVYRMAELLYQQDPTIASFAVCRRQHAAAQVVQLTFSSSNALDTYKFTVVGYDGTSHAISVASTGVPATDAVTIATALTALSNVGTVTHASAVVTLTQAVGNLIDVQGWASTIGFSGAPIVSLFDATADAGGAAGIAQDLANARGLDQGWYGVALDSNSSSEIAAAAAWCEANTVVFSTNTSDLLAQGASTGIFYTLKQLTYKRTLVQFNGSQLLSWGGVALLGVILPMSPGSYTCAFKTQVGVPTDTLVTLSANAINNITANNGNYYTSYKNTPVLLNGITPGGTYLDTTIFVDWQTDQIQTDVFGVLTQNAKIGMTDPGVAKVVSTVKGSLNNGILAEGLAAFPAPTVSAPLVAAISQANLAGRNLPNLTFTATLAGAIQSTQINGSIVLP